MGIPQSQLCDWGLLRDQGAVREGVEAVFSMAQHGMSRSIRTGYSSKMGATMPYR